MPAQRVFACISCTRRKVKCDKEQPICSTCARLNVDCVYGDLPLPQQKRRRVNDESRARLEQYEHILRQHGLLPTHDSPRSLPEPPPISGTLIHKPDGRRYVDSVLWNAIKDHDECNESEESTPDFHPALLSSAFLGVSHLKQDLTPYAPTEEELSAIISIYFDRVDSLLRILHKPTAADAVSNPALLFAICLISVTSLSDDECMQTFGVSRDSLTTRYHTATQYALLNADFLRSSSITTLQAYTLFIITNRSRFDASVVWTMVGIGLRTAQRMGVHRDGSLTGLNPFDTEMNRRLFWQYHYLERFAGQTAGINSSLEESKWDTHEPLNINDEDIWPGMTESPRERTGATEMIFQLTKSKFVQVYDHLGPILVTLERDVANTELVREAERRMHELEDLIESRFLRFCDPMNPLHLVAATMARAGIDCGSFRIYLPRAKAGMLSDDEQERLYHLAMKIFDRLEAAYLNSALDKFRWHTEMFVVWDIIIWLVNYVRREPQRKAAWKSLGGLCKHHPDFIAPHQALTFAVIKLVLRAWDAQATGEDEPDFISHLRQSLRARQATQQADKDSVRDSSLAFESDVTHAYTQPPLPEKTAPNAPPDQASAYNGSLYEQGDGFDWEFWDRLMRDPDALGLPSWRV